MHTVSRRVVRCLQCECNPLLPYPSHTFTVDPSRQDNGWVPNFPIPFQRKSWTFLPGCRRRYKQGPWVCRRQLERFFPYPLIYEVRVRGRWDFKRRTQRVTSFGWSSVSSSLSGYTNGSISRVTGYVIFGHDTVTPKLCSFRKITSIWLFLCRQVEFRQKDTTEIPSWK